MGREWRIGRLLCIVCCISLALSGLAACTSTDDPEETINPMDSSGQEDGNPFPGQWQNDDGTVCLDIWMDDQGIVYGSISREESTDAVMYWDFSGTIDGNVFTYQNATKTYAEYDAEGASEDQVYYTDGTGSITYKDGSLYWKEVPGDQDDSNDTGAEYTFTYIGEY